MQSKINEKAIELVNNFHSLDFDNPDSAIGGSFYNISRADAIQCALICVDEILSTVPMYTGGLNPLYKFYQEVKQELLNLK